MSMSASTFIGRESEIRVFKAIIRSKRSDIDVLYLQGEGGIGKTKLLEQLQTLCSARRFPCTQIIDFYDTDNQTVIGLMNRIAADVSTSILGLSENNPVSLPFALYQDASARARGARESNIDSDQARGFEQKAGEQFLLDYNQIAEQLVARNKRIVLFFDTLDAIQEFRDVTRWFLYTLIPSIKNTIVVFAGRYDLPKATPFTPLIRNVERFSLAETKEYFRSRNIYSKELQASSNRRRIYALTDGNPLFTTLVADWLLDYPDRHLGELLGRGSRINEEEKRRFRQQLIVGVISLDRPAEYEAVWYMSHIYHRFNAEILAWITDRPLDKAAAIIKNLSQLPFVKYRSQSRSYQLHDVMRDLVRGYVMDQLEDVDKKLRQGLSNRMITYYDNEIANLSAVSNLHDIHVMKAEQLYHYFYTDLNDGFARFNQLAKEADDLEDIPFSDLLLANSSWYYEYFVPEQAAVHDVYKGWLAKRLGRPLEAEEILRKNLEILIDKKNPLVDVVASSLGHTYKELGQFGDARRMYEQALELNEQSTKEPQERVKAEAQILNNLGNLLRLQGLVHEAHQYSISSLMLRQRLKDSVGLANSYYILGLILREFGDDSGALRYLDRAESEYSNLPSEISRQKGLANIIRIRAYICNEVRDHEKAVQLAKESFYILSEKIGTPSTDLADALDILGRLIRDKAADDYQRERDGNEKAALARRNKAFQEAEDYIERGYRMAQKVEDKFKEAESILSYVRLFYLRGDYRTSLDWYKKGISICQPRKYYLLLSYFELFAGSNYFALGKYNKAFEKFARRALHASRCRAMELGMTMDSLAGYLERLEDPKLISKYANYLMHVWRTEQPDWPLEQHFPQILELCEDIKKLASL